MSRLDPARRARDKARSRAADEIALASGRVAPDELRKQNEVFVCSGALAKIDLSAARALA
jgi:hypothetical protein